jgi:hypothetical protein
MAELYSRVTEIETHLGMPQRRSLLVRNHDSKAKVNQDFLISPPPYITSVPIKLVGLPFGNITVSQNDFLVEIPRTASEDLFVKKTGTGRVTFVIDPPIQNGQIIYSNPTTKSIDSGIKCRLLYLYDDDPLIWKLILTKDKD